MCAFFIIVIIITFYFEICFFLFIQKHFKSTYTNRNLFSRVPTSKPFRFCNLSDGVLMLLFFFDFFVIFLLYSVASFFFSIFNSFFLVLCDLHYYSILYRYLQFCYFFLFMRKILVTITFIYDNFSFLYFSDDSTEKITRQKEK